MLCIVYFSKFLIFFHQLLTAWLIALRRQVPGGGGAVHGRHCGRRRAVHMYVTLSHHIVFIYKIIFCFGFYYCCYRYLFVPPSSSPCTLCPMIIIIIFVFIIVVGIISILLCIVATAEHSNTSLLVIVDFFCYL